MKKRSIFALLLAAVMIFAVACETDAPAGSGAPAGPAADDGPFPGKIAIVSSPLDQNEEEFRSAEQIVAKYGVDKVLHLTYPANFMAEAEQLITIVTSAAADPDVRILILNQAVPGMIPAVDRVLQMRDDLFIVFCNPQEDAPEVGKRANLALNPDTPGRGTLFAEAAHNFGASTIVHYSFPRHMSQPQNAARRNNMEARSAELGIEFINATAPDPTGEGGLSATQLFMYEDIPRMVEAYGPDTVIFATNCGMQTPILNMVMDYGLMYVEPCCPSPFHAFPNALGIEVPPGMGDVNFVIGETTRILGEHDMLGRIGNWPVPLAFLYTHVGVEYAIRAVNGEVPYDVIDIDVLAEVVQNYIFEVVGQDLSVILRPYTEPFFLEAGQEPDVVVDNFIWFLIEHLVY
ncbi:MAG: DUF3798 domain-containing protein [Defluviitaleaceae bacterium]|nr:DUF3798 domain-containing protein [Defluviitaleaceae bacterium]MCL2835841.1 DUF3798 domain-containing protein [Defluviitaleaceae bacterium]